MTYAPPHPITRDGGTAVRIAALLFDYPPTTTVGAPLMTAELLEALAEAGHDVTVYSASCVLPYDWRGVRVSPRFGIKEQLEADVVIAHPDGGVIGPNVAKASGAAYVGIVHNVGLANRGALRNNPPDLCVFNAEATRAHFRRDGIVARSLLRVDDHATARDGAEHVTLVNLSALKGSKLFYRLSQRVDAPFLGVRGGYGNQDERPLDAEIVGPVPHGEMPAQVWSRTAVLVAPSVAESWGRAAVEALCSGIPVVASPTPGLREALADAGTFVPISDIAGWERAVRRLLDPAAAAEASERALARARELEKLTAGDRVAFVAAVEALA